jgi:hypothetical protein
MRALKWIVGLVLLAGLAVGGYTVWERLSRVESTDDAQIDAFSPEPSRSGREPANVHDQPPSE